MSVDLVIKLGGGVLAHVEPFEAVLAAIGEAARVLRVVVVPAADRSPRRYATSTGSTGCRTAPPTGWRCWRWISTPT